MNNYMFIRVVGKGSYGEVNLVKHKTDRKQVRIQQSTSIHGLKNVIIGLFDSDTCIPFPESSISQQVSN